MYSDSYIVDKIHGIVDPTKNCTGEQIIQLVEEKFTSTNTGSPKLPTLVECERWYVTEKCGFERITELEKNVVREIHDYMCRQLRAGA